MKSKAALGAAAVLADEADSMGIEAEDADGQSQNPGTPPAA